MTYSRKKHRIENVSGNPAELNSQSCQAGTIVDVLRKRALRQGQRPAFTFWAEEESQAQTLTFEEVDVLARSAAVWLQSQCEAGSRVLLAYPTGPEFVVAFMGCLYSKMIAVPIHAQFTRNQYPRIQAIEKDAQAALALTTPAFLENRKKLAKAAANGDAGSHAQWLAMDSGSLPNANQWRGGPTEANALAFLQYTSGSTATPKGVMISHRNLMESERMIQSAFRQTDKSVIVNWLPLYHDMGLIGGMLQPLYLGAHCVLLAPEAFLQNPVRWLRAVSKYQASTSGGPNFAYDLCVRKVTAEQKKMLDLSSWTVAFNGAEPIRSQTLLNFAAAFTECGFNYHSFHPCYGLAEASLIVSGKQTTGGPLIRQVHHEGSHITSSGEAGRLCVSSGGIASGQNVVIVDPATKALCVSYQVGEVWVQGLSVAEGYWNRALETEEVFGAYLEDEPNRRYMRTGDLGFLDGEDLFIVGRLKDVIIIRGSNYYPEDIEQTVEKRYPGMYPNSCAAVSIHREGVEELIIIQERNPRASQAPEQALQEIRSAVLAAHRLPLGAVVMIAFGSLPRTSSGKVRRSFCRESYLKRQLQIVAEWQAAPVIPENASTSDPFDGTIWETAKAMEQWLKGWIAERLGSTPAQVDGNLPLTDYALDSLAATELAYALQKAGACIEMAEILECASITQLALQIVSEGAARNTTSKQATAGPSKGYALSRGQQAIWLAQRMGVHKSIYNIGLSIALQGRIDKAAFLAAWNSVIDRHPSLGSVFRQSEENVVQCPGSFPKASIQTMRAEVSWDAGNIREKIQEEVYRQFDPGNGPLVRILLMERTEEEWILVLSAHHLVADFWSLGIILRDFGEFYHAHCEHRELPAPAAGQYAGYVEEQERLLAGPEGESQWKFWQETLDGVPGFLDLPTDRPRKNAQTFSGATLHFRIAAEDNQKIKQFASSNRTTAYSVIMAALQALLYRYTGQTAFSIGSAAAGRGSATFADTVGYFTNLILIKASCLPETSFRAHVAQVRQNALEAFQNQDYPFPLLVERLQPARHAGVHPLCQVMFNYLSDPPPLPGLAAAAFHVENATLRLGPLAARSLSFEDQVALFDLTVGACESRGDLILMLNYSNDLFDKATALAMGKHLQTLLQGGVAGPDIALADLPLLATAEKQQLVEEWNKTQISFSRRTLHQLFEEQAAISPAAIAVSCGAHALTYSELNARANQLAHFLRQSGVGPEKKVGMCLERSTDLITAILGTMKAGGVYVPLDPSYPAQRLELILQDADPLIVLTQKKLAGSLPEFRGTAIPIDKDGWQIEGFESNNPPLNVLSCNLAYVIYTSGSTGRPKGVGITHENLANFAGAMSIALGNERRGKWLALSNVCFDISLLELLWPLTSGFQIVIADARELAGVQTAVGQESETRFAMALEHPDAAEILLASLASATHLQCTPSLMRLLLDNFSVTRAMKQVNNVLLGGELLPASLVRELRQATCARIFNMYGPTETTIWSAMHEMREDMTLSVPIGRPIANTEVYVINETLELAPVSSLGELYIGGNGVARGYLNQPGLTAARFVPDPFSKQPGKRLYRTGDQARWSRTGALEFLGRLDQQVKVRGHRIELEEIESVLETHPAIESAAVLARDVAGTTILVAYLVATEANQTLNMEAIRKHLQTRLPEYMVPGRYALLARLPLTPNGKLDRNALQHENCLFLHGGYVPPRTPVEEMLCGIWGELTGAGSVGIYDSFFDLGGHSLLATQAVSRIRANFGCEIGLRCLFENPTVAAMALSVEKEIHHQDTAERMPLMRTAQTGDLPLSFSQERLWFIDQLEPGNPVYTNAVAIDIEGLLDAKALRQSLQEVVRRHEVLRACFTEANGRPVQEILALDPMSLPLVDLGICENREAVVRMLARQHARHRFDLNRGYLINAGLLRLDGNRHVLLLAMHHIVSDGWSFGVLAQEITLLYEAYVKRQPSPLPELEIQYSDYAIWQKHWMESEAFKAHLEYWRKQLFASQEILELPLDRVRPKMERHHGARVPVSLDCELNERLKKLSRKHGATLFMTLLSALNVLLFRCTGQEDISIGTPVANRRRLETEPLIGFFANTLVLRTCMAGEPAFEELLQRVRETALQAYAHQEMPFEQLVKELQPGRDLSRSPLFQVMLVLQEKMRESLRLGEATLSIEQIDGGTSKFDLSLVLTDSESGLTGFFEYNTDILDEETVTQMAGYWVRLVKQAALDPQARVSELKLLAESELAQIISEWNRTDLEDFDFACLPALFEWQEQKKPDQVAILCGEGHLTYRTLNQRANQLARYLKKAGVGPEMLVGVCMERDPRLLIAMLAILKAGGAYVALDPSYPTARLQYILEDAKPRVLVSEKVFLQQHEISIPAMVQVFIDSEAALIQEENPDNLEQVIDKRNLSHVIYTSGSTGKPKGSGIVHGSVSVLLHWARNVFSAFELQGVLASTSVCFDLSVFEIFVPLCWGGKVVLIENLLELADIPDTHAITLINTVPSVMRELMRIADLPPGVVTVNLAGEALPASLVRELYKQPHVHRVFNLYGPTEDTTYSSWALIDPAGEKVPIGYPVANTQIHVLDRYLQPVPIGATGEIYISGDGLCRGYLGNPAMSASRFIPNPFGTTGTRMYRTGDIGRRTRTGTLEYQGRADNQVKLRGFRIELGEIEAVLQSHRDIEASAVTVCKDSRGERLTAFVILQENATSGKAELRKYLQEKLPEYMVPTAFVMVNEFPRTVNGKIDRKRLSFVQGEMSLDIENHVAPQNVLQEVIYGLWCELLGLEKLSIHDNVFAMGAHSLLATQFVAHLQALLGVRISIAIVFLQPTIAEFSEAMIENFGIQIMDAAETAKYIALLSDTQVDAALLSTETIQANLE